MVVDGDRLVGQLVGHLDAEELRPRGVVVDQRVAEIAGEELVEVVVGERILRRRQRQRAVEALGLEGDVVGAGELVGDRRAIFAGVSGS